MPRIARLMILVLMSAASGPAGAADVLVKASRVETVSGAALEPGAVLVSDGKIKLVGPELTAGEGVEVVDLGAGSVLTPGLIDADAPIVIDSSPTEFSRELTPEFRVEPAIDWKSRSYLEQLREGVTSVGLLPGADNVIGGLGCVVKTGGKPGERVLERDAALVMAVCSDPANRNRSRQRPDSIYLRQPTNRMGVVSMLRLVFDATKKGLEEAPALDGQAVVPLRTIREFVSGGKPIIALSRTDFDIKALLRLGEEFGFRPVLLGGQEAYLVRSELASQGVAVILGPITSTAVYGPEQSRVAWNSPGLLRAAGVPVSLSGGNLLEQARFARRFGLQRTAALESATIEPAKALGIADRVGTIEPGKDADLVAFGGDPLEFKTPIRWVMVNGEIQDETRGPDDRRKD
jgi:imidazolonepropionase-like amidohydrolase